MQDQKIIALYKNSVKYPYLSINNLLKESMVSTEEYAEIKRNGISITRYRKISKNRDIIYNFLKEIIQYNNELIDRTEFNNIIKSLSNYNKEIIIKTLEDIIYLTDINVLLDLVINDDKQEQIKLKLKNYMHMS